MGYKRAISKADSEEDIQKAIISWKNSQFRSLRATAIHFQVPLQTLRDRMAGRKAKAQAHEEAQLLSNAEEKTLVRWITRLTSTGFPATPTLVVETAEEIRHGRVKLASSQNTPPTQLPPIGHEWLYRFLNRYPILKGTYSRQLESTRHKEATYEKISRWFSVFRTQFDEQNYELENIYNMDETGFAVGTTQSTRIIVDSTQKSSWKITPGKQEWITAIECVNAAGGSLSPMVIFKAKNTNSGWIPENTPANWRFSTSNSGWTSNSHGFEWLQTVFEPESRQKSKDKPRLLIADGHASHITANMIALCMENNIDLLILPPHCSHLLQPLDVGVFGPMKKYHAYETDRLLRAGINRFQRSEWVTLYQVIRAKALSPENIRSGWRGAGLVPFSERRVLSKLPVPLQLQPTTPQQPTPASNLDLLVLRSSPPDGTELRAANSAFNLALSSYEPPATPTRRYATRVTKLLERQNAELVVLRKEINEHRAILQQRNTHKKGKRIKLQGEFVFSTADVLRIAREAEEKPVAKRPRGRPRKRPIEEVDEEEEEEGVLSDSSSSEYEGEVIVVRNTRSRARQLEK